MAKTALFFLFFGGIFFLSWCGTQRPTFIQDKQADILQGVSNGWENGSWFSGRGRQGRGNFWNGQMSWSGDRSGSGDRARWSHFGSGNFWSGDFWSGQMRNFSFPQEIIDQLPEEGKILVKQIETAQASGDMETARILRQQLRDSYPNIFPARRPTGEYE